MTRRLLLVFLYLGLLLGAGRPPPSLLHADDSPEVVINEVAWGGTAANPADEWIELFNNSSQPVDLTGWTLTSDDGSPNITLQGTIPPGGYFLLERTDDNTISDIPADQIYTGALKNSGERLTLRDASGTVVDTANGDGGNWPAGTASSGTPPYASMERRDPQAPDCDANWGTNDGQTKNGLDAEGNPINGTPKAPNSVTIATATPSPSPTATATPTSTSTATITPTLTPAPTFTPTPTPTLTATFTPSPTPSPTPTPTATSSPTPTPIPTAAPLLISEVCYDGTTPNTEGDEFVELYNPLSSTVSLAGYKLGDEETRGGGEGMYCLPITGTIGPGEVILVAKNGAQFHERFGFWPDFEVRVSGDGYQDTPAVPNLERYSEWGSGSWALSNGGDEVLLLGPDDSLVDAAVFKSGDGKAVGVSGTLSAPEPRSLQRVLGPDTDDMPADFAIAEPNPGQLTQLPAPPESPPSSPDLGSGMHAYWGCLHSHSTYSDGSGPPRYAYAVGRANGLHFLALTDHSHMYDAQQWADLEEQAAAATEEGAFVALRGFEWTSREGGHINVFNTTTSVSRNDPPYDTLVSFYPWLADQVGAVAQFNHPFAGDFNDLAYDEAADGRISLLEVGNGNRARYRRFEEAYIRALGAGWHVGPANNGDTETPDWGADTPHRTGIVAPALTRAYLLDALRARRTFATEDSNLALALRTGGRWMGEVITTSGDFELTVIYQDADGEGAEVALYDRTLPIGTMALSSNATWVTTVSGAPGHFYWARAEQADGDLAYTSPLWVAGQAPPEKVFLNELCPAPLNVDWDGSGEAGPGDEWVELYNGESHTVGLGGWQLDDEAEGGSAPWTFPLTCTIPAHGYLVLFKAETGVALNDDGDSVRLLRPDGSVADEMSYARSPGHDRTWSRTEDGGGEWTTEYEPTMGKANKYERKKPPSEKKKPAAPAPQAVTLPQARALPLGTLVVVQGQVTAPPGALKGGVIYIQDAGAGVKVYLREGTYPLLEEGDWVQVEGKLSDYHGEREIIVSSEAEVHRLGSGSPLEPKSIATGELGESCEGLLVEVVGRVTGWGRDAIYLDDGSGEVKVYFGRSELVEKPWVEEGELYLIVGLASQYVSAKPYEGGYRLLPRYRRDVVAAPLELPVTGGDLLTHAR